MAASRSSSSSSPGSSSSSAAKAKPDAPGAPAAPFGTPAADPAAVQNMFEQWLNTWRAVADPAQWQKLAAQANRGHTESPGPASANPFAALGGFPSFPGFPGFPGTTGGNSGSGGSSQLPFAMPAMPNIPTTAIAPQRLQELQSSFSRDATELIKQEIGRAHV